MLFGFQILHLLPYFKEAENHSLFNFLEEHVVFILNLYIYKSLSVYLKTQILCVASRCTLLQLFSLTITNCCFLVKYLNLESICYTQDHFEIGKISH